MKRKLLIILLITATISISIGCGNKDKSTSGQSIKNEQIKNINIKEIVDMIISEIQLRAMSTVDDNIAKEILKLDLDSIESYYIQKGQMNTGLETIGIIKAKNEKIDSIKASLEEYKNSINPFYPGEQEAVDNTKIIHKGNYIGFFLIPDYEEGQNNLDKAIDIFENYFN